MKKLLVALGGIFLVLLLVLVLGVGYAAYRGSGLDESSKAYVETTVPPILASWSVEKLRQEAAPQLITVIDRQPELVGKVFEKLVTLGALKSFHNVKGDANIYVSADTGETITALYTADAEFENGAGKVSIRLFQANEQWRILELKVNAPKLIE